MDGVLADFDASACKILDRKDLNYRTEVMAGDALEAKKKRWLDIEQTPGFWENLQPIVGVESMLAAASKLSEIFVLSTAPSAKRFIKGDEYVQHIIDAKKAWIARYFGKFFAPEHVIIVRDSKEKIAKSGPDSLLIDDRAENISDWINAGGRGIVFKSPSQVIKDMSGEF